MPSLSPSGASSASALASFRLIESFRRLPTSTATSRALSMWRLSCNCAETTIISRTASRPGLHRGTRCYPEGMVAKAGKPRLKSTHEELGRIYRALFEASHDVIVLQDESSRIMDINPRGAEITGYELAELHR